MPLSRRLICLSLSAVLAGVGTSAWAGPQARLDTLMKQAEWLKRYGNVTVQIEGHADERGTREYNIALSARRGTVAREFLVSQGIEPARITTIAFGKERPVALCDAESCWSQNRRAVTVVTAGAVTQ